MQGVTRTLKHPSTSYQEGVRRIEQKGRPSTWAEREPVTVVEPLENSLLARVVFEIVIGDSITPEQIANRVAGAVRTLLGI